jgi:hypothetical protein
MHDVWRRRVGDVICGVVNRYAVSWVVSAGNHGPALCTVGAPPDIAQPVLIGIVFFCQICFLIVILNHLFVQR